MSFTPTTKTNEALQAALKSASAAGNPDIRPAHLLVALLEQEDGIAAPLLTAAGVEPTGALTRAREIVSGYPSAQGSNMANPQFNRDALNALTAAEELAGELGDEYVSTEILLIGIATGQSDVAKSLQDAGATPEALKGALTSVRGNRKVTTEDPDRVVGFHWTKVHKGGEGAADLGEVYAVGVDPEQQGGGLGRALTAAGINHLAEEGLEEVMLYVDADNTAAVSLYESLGFERWHVDVMYRG